MEVYFSHPEYLLFLLLLPVMIFVHFLSIKFTKRTALKFANFDALSKIKDVDFYSKNVFILVLSSIVIMFLICSLAGLTIKVQREVSEFSFIIAIDSSESMSAIDFPPNRLEAAKDNALRFVDIVPSGTRVGIISFAGSAIIEERITIDKVLMRNAIRNINLTSMGGTDISETLITATNQLFDEESKAIIILSDGQINVGSLDQAVDYAIRNEVVIHSVGIGTEQGGMTFYGLSKLDVDSLKSLAYNTKGTYTEVINRQQLDESFNSILNFKMRDVPYDISKYALMIAIILFVIEFALVSTKFRIYP